MGPSFKISFPIPAWKPNSSAQTTPGSQTSNRSDQDATPASYPGSKAERLLGGASFDGGELKKKQSKKERKSLRKYPSFMSVTLADMDHESSRGEDHEFPFPGMKIPLDSNQPLRRQASSPLLGDPTTPLSPGTDYFSGAPNNQQARHAESSSPLRSHYDRSGSSLLVSQQTSASSIRDQALRKGMASAPSPLSHHLASNEDLRQDSPHSRNHSGDSRGSEASKISSSTKIARMPRRRPSVNDPPTLYPNASRPFYAVSPPPALVNSSVPRPMHLADPQNKSFSRPKWWYRSKTERPTSPDAVMSGGLANQEESGQRSSSVKLHVRKPKAGARNWFDGLDESEVFVKAEEPQVDTHQGSKNNFSERSDANSALSETPRKERDSLLKTRKSSFSSRSGPSDRKLSFRIDETPARRTPRNFSPTPGAHNRPALTVNADGKRTRSTESPRGIPDGIDLQMQSVLNLSSSDDEEKDAVSIPSRQSSYRGHRIRASVERADHGDDILLGSAQRVQQVRPRAAKSQIRSSSRRSKSPDDVPPVPQLPQRPDLGQRNSSLRWRDMMDEKSTTTTDAGGDSTVESGSNNADTPLTSPFSSRTSVSTHKKKFPFRGSKLMKVTSEEEKLLEAMREKRASIRANDYQKGFDRAMALQAGTDLFAPRPQTAGADGSQPFQRTSSLYEPLRSSRGSISPPALLSSARYRSHAPKASLASLGAGSRKSVSTDNLLFSDDMDEAYPFPAVPEIVRPLPAQPPSLSHQHMNISPAKPSPSLSFGTMGDAMIPGTPSTGNLPITPPPTSVPFLERSLSRGTAGKNAGYLGMAGHERKRTASSGVVMLDGVEVAAREADEEREIIGWALDSY